MAAKVVVSQPKILESSPERLLDGGVCRCDLVLVKGGAVGVDDDCVGRRHFDDYLFDMFYYKTPYLWLILTI